MKKSNVYVIQLTEIQFKRAKQLSKSLSQDHKNALAKILSKAECLKPNEYGLIENW